MPVNLVNSNKVQQQQQHQDFALSRSVAQLLLRVFVSLHGSRLPSIMQRPAHEWTDLLQ